MFFLLFFRLRTLLFIFVGTLVSGVIIVNEVKHRLNAVETTATLLERISKCRVEFNTGAERRTFTQTIVAAAQAQEMQCGAAQSLQDRLGDDKVTLHRTDLVRLSYVGADGTTNETTVEAGVAPKDAKVGSQFPVVYDPDQPKSLRTPSMDIVLAVATAFFLFGLMVIGVIFGLNPARLAGRLASASGAGRVRDKTANWTKSAEEAIARAAEPPPPPPPVPHRAAAYSSERTFGRRAAGR